MVPSVDLLDARSEPSDDDLAALMLDFRRIVAIRSADAQDRHLAALAHLIEARPGRPWTPTMRPGGPPLGMAPDAAGLPSPALIAVAGPNGSGKTTWTDRAIAHGWLDGCECVNPDAIAEREFGSWNDPNAILKAAREAARRRRSCLEQGRPLAFEAVLSTAATLNLVRQAASRGHFVRLFFLGTDSPQINARRVAARVMAGGHDVPIPKIIRRHPKSIANLAQAVQFVHRAYVYDNSVEGEAPQLLFRTAEGALHGSRKADRKWAQPVMAGLRGMPKRARSKPKPARSKGPT